MPYFKTFLCFDVEQFADATEELELSRAIGVNHPITWRIRTNAPTRYIVNPAYGVTVRLVKNRFHPSHKLILQAMRTPPKCDERTAWKHENAKNAACVQTIRLGLSTMLMNIDYTENVSSDVSVTFAPHCYQLYCGCLEREELSSSQSVDSLQSVMAQSSTIGIDRIRELENLLAMLNADKQQIQKNAAQGMTLKKVLHKALDARRSTLIALKGRLIEMKKQTRRWKEELLESEAELENFQRSRKEYFVQQCSVS
ncbi:unnamed protein product [Toxocara canis]|uniref:Major sperm protein n=1 Tax=Toxocara canis TaxID=6265 RepID=A0A183UIN4_TOXCA|nr:unnamed protein product [Toxocara canis]